MSPCKLLMLTSDKKQVQRSRYTSFSVYSAYNISIIINFLGINVSVVCANQLSFIKLVCKNIGYEWICVAQ